MKKWIFIIILFFAYFAPAAPDEPNAVDTFQNAILQLHTRIAELLKIIESQEAEIARLKELCKDARVETDPPVKTVKKSPMPDEINEPFYGIYLGEKLDSLRKRTKLSKGRYAFVDKTCPAKIWSVRNKDPRIKNILVCTFNERIYEIDIEFKNTSEEDCRAMKSKLELTYPSVYRDRYEQLLGKSTYQTQINGIDIGIILNCDTSAGRNRKLKLTYVNMPLLEQMQNGIKSRNPVKSE